MCLYMTNMLPFFRDKTEGPIPRGMIEYANCIGMRKVGEFQWQPYLCAEMDTLSFLMNENPGEWFVIDNRNRPTPGANVAKIETQTFQIDISQQMREFDLDNGQGVV